MQFDSLLKQSRKCYFSLFSQCLLNALFQILSEHITFILSSVTLIPHVLVLTWQLKYIWCSPVVLSLVICWLANIHPLVVFSRVHDNNILCILAYSYFLLPLYFKDSLARYKILGSFICSFSVLQEVYHCLLALTNAMEKFEASLSDLMFLPGCLIDSFFN